MDKEFIPMEIFIFSKFWVRANWFTRLFWFKSNNSNLPKEFQKFQYWARIKC
jgi:hypothetical protein